LGCEYRTPIPTKRALNNIIFLILFHFHFLSFPSFFSFVLPFVLPFSFLSLFFLFLSLFFLCSFSVLSLSFLFPFSSLSLLYPFFLFYIYFISLFFLFSCLPAPSGRNFYWAQQKSTHCKVFHRDTLLPLPVDVKFVCKLVKV
jgi:hypothetical protein